MILFITCHIYNYVKIGKNICILSIILYTLVSLLLLLSLPKTKQYYLLFRSFYRFFLPVSYLPNLNLVNCWFVLLKIAKLKYSYLSTVHYVF